VDGNEPVVDNSTGEIIPSEEIIETVTDSAVEIAQIEAAKEVAIAEIHADVEIAHIEQRAETQEILREEIEEEKTWQQNVTNLLERVTETMALIAGVLLTPPLSAEEVTISTPISTLEEINETQTELTPESVAEEQVAEIPLAELPVKVKRRAI
jgi:hypothetical protein